MSNDKKPETKPETPAVPVKSDLEKAVELVASQLIPSAIAAAVAAVSAGRPVQAAPEVRNAAHLSNRRCSECGQLAVACKDKHTKMVVYPLRYPHHADYFTGVFINGVKYLSNGDGHEVVVPADCAPTIKQIVERFEINEQEMQSGRIAERHSGTVSPAGSSFTPQSSAWR